MSNSVLNVKSIVGAFNQEALVLWAFSVIVKRQPSRRFVSSSRTYPGRHLVTCQHDPRPTTRNNELLRYKTPRSPSVLLFPVRGSSLATLGMQEAATATTGPPRHQSSHLPFTSFNPKSFRQVKLCSFWKSECETAKYTCTMYIIVYYINHKWLSNNICYNFQAT